MKVILTSSVPDLLARSVRSDVDEIEVVLDSGFKFHIVPYGDNEVAIIAPEQQAIVIPQKGNRVNVHMRDVFHEFELLADTFITCRHCMEPRAHVAHGKPVYPAVK